VKTEIINKINSYSKKQGDKSLETYKEFLDKIKIGIDLWIALLLSSYPAYLTGIISGQILLQVVIILFIFFISAFLIIYFIKVRWIKNNISEGLSVGDSLRIQTELRDIYYSSLYPLALIHWKYHSPTYHFVFPKSEIAEVWKTPVK
jgi:hypothetical protein